MRMILSVLLCWSLWPASLAAQERPVVVELFTSQGCSSCPPAEALMPKLAARDDVIPLALHVDYWDYIGWKDEFADPAYSRRQKAYAHAGGRHMVYTPQMIVNGVEDVVGAHAMELAELIAAHAARPSPVSLTLERDDGVLRIHADPVAGAAGGPYDIHLVRYTPRRESHITRGENAGRDLVHVNVVDGWSVLERWDGRGPLDVTAQLTDDRPAVVLVQQPGPGPIVAAARID